jgi:hypothetical protein
VVQGEDGQTTKVHYHKWCSKLREWKEEHVLRYGSVLDDLVGQFRAKERAAAAAEEEERRRRAAEEEESYREMIRLLHEEESAVALDSDRGRGRSLTGWEDASDRAVDGTPPSELPAVDDNEKRKSMVGRVSKKLSVVTKLFKSGRNNNSNKRNSSIAVAVADEAPPSVRMATPVGADEDLPSPKKTNEKSAKKRASKKFKNVRKGMWTLFSGCKGNNSNNSAVDEQATEQRPPSQERTPLCQI